MGQSEYCLNISQGNDPRERTKNEAQEISREVEKYGDIVMRSFTDSLKNTYKRCPQAELIVKTEVNIFLNFSKELKNKIRELVWNASSKFKNFCGW